MSMAAVASRPPTAATAARAAGFATWPTFTMPIREDSPRPHGGLPELCGAKGAA
jgi:hypothetical protein